MATILFIVIMIFIGVSIYAYMAKSVSDDKISLEYMNEKKKALEKAKIAQDEYNKVLSELGNPELTHIEYNSYTSDSSNKQMYLSLFKEKRKIWILDTLCDFEDIDGITISVQKYVSHKNNTETTMSTGKVIKRAAVGGLLLGPVGAAIGAATTTKDERVVSVDKYEEIDYTLKISHKGGISKMLFLDEDSELNKWSSELESVTNIKPYICLEDDIDTDLFDT